jgi:hypothetical protein
MARHRTVSEAFKTLIDRLQPLQAEVDARDRHRATIKQALEGEFSAFNRVEVFGSHSRGSAIRSHSDVDYLAVLGKDDISKGGSIVASTTTLGRIKKALEARFPTTNVRIRGCAVIVEFSDGAVDVVPGVWTATAPSSGHPVFAIPDGNGDWRSSSPQVHKKYLADANVSSGSHLFYTAQLLKTWRVGRQSPVPFLGFHVEMLLASESICTPGKSYAVCMRDGLRLIRDRSGRALQDPVGVSGYIAISGTEAQRDDVVSCATNAAAHAQKAIDAEQCNDDEEAFRQWGIVFKNFPSRWA